jgi:DNA topoisomerase I
VQVFRTYNASVTLDRLLTEQEQQEAEARGEAEEARQKLESPTVDKRKADYDRANKEVRHVCGRQLPMYECCV